MFVFKFGSVCEFLFCKLYLFVIIDLIVFMSGELIVLNIVDILRFCFSEMVLCFLSSYVGSCEGFKVVWVVLEII